MLHPKLLLIFLAPPLFLLFSGRDWAYDVRVHSHVFGFDLSGMPSFVRRLLVGPATVSRSGLERESLALSEMFSQKLAGATIPALMHQIPSELRS